MAAETATSNPPFAKGSIIWEKKGPLPVWAWALLLLGLVLAVTLWRRNKATADATEATAGYDVDVPDGQAAPPVFIVPAAPTPPVTVTTPVTVTVPSAPPGAGREAPPATKAPPKPKPPPGKMVSVVQWTAKNTPWNSTISGIAAHYKIADWHSVWNHPLNADLRRKRGNDPKLIRPGDSVFVPGAK